MTFSARKLLEMSEGVSPLVRPGIPQPARQRLKALPTINVHRVLKSRDPADSRRRSYSVGALDNDLLGLNIPSDKKTLLPIDRKADPMTNPAAPQGVADDQRPLCPWRFSVLKSRDPADNHRRSCSHGALDNDLIGLNIPSDKR